MVITETGYKMDWPILFPVYLLMFMCQWAKSHLPLRGSWIPSGLRSVWVVESISHPNLHTGLALQWLTHCLVLLLHFYFTVLRIRLDPQNISVLQSIIGYNFPPPLTNTFKFRDWKDISDVKAKSKSCWNECQRYAVIKLFLFFRNCRLPVCLSSNNVRNAFMIFSAL